MTDTTIQPLDLQRREPVSDRAFKALTLAAGLVVLAILALIAYSTTDRAWPAFEEEGLDFFLDDRWAPAEGIFGGLAFIYGTLVTSVIAVVLAVPVSIGIALFVTQVSPAWVRKPIVYVVDLLAVIPSVVFGLWGVLFLAPKLTGLYDNISGWTSSVPLVDKLTAGPIGGKSLFTAGMILAIMITPIITSLAREVIDTTPPGEREAALALGSTRWEMIQGAVFPHAAAGLVGAVMLGLGRAMGETIAAALVIGSSPQVTSRLFAPGDSMPAVIANQFGEASGTHRAALIGLGVSLFVFTIIVNMGARAVVERSVRRARGVVA